MQSTLDVSNESTATTAEEEEEALGLDQLPLHVRVMNVVQSHRTLRPQLLAAELGISVDDACAELCGLLAAVGGGNDGAQFTFETLDDKQQQQQRQHMVMVFSFPPDFATRALRYKQKEEFKQWVLGTLNVVWKALKILTGLGLILSLLIVGIAVVAGMVAVLIGMSQNRQGNGHHRSHHLNRQIRSMLFNLRQLLWCYAVFAPHGEDGQQQDVFLRDAAFDLALLFSLPFGSPANIFFWMRAHQLARRRRRAAYGWGGRRIIPSDIEGVQLIRNGTWHDAEHESFLENTRADVVQRGLLSVIVEFLFGPENSSATPTEPQKWMLRGGYIVKTIEDLGEEKLTLERLCPFTDSPPRSIRETDRIVAQGLKIVAHFNGHPRLSGIFKSPTKAVFGFPELIAEKGDVLRICGSITEYQGNDDLLWETLLYKQEPQNVTHQSFSSTERNLSYLYEYQIKFSTLAKDQFLRCTALVLLNLVGVLWLGESIKKGGTLEVHPDSALGHFLHRLLVPLLRFYALLYLVVPLSRLLVIIIRNKQRCQRNELRQKLANELKNN